MLLGRLKFNCTTSFYIIIINLRILQSSSRLFVFFLLTFLKNLSRKVISKNSKKKTLELSREQMNIKTITIIRRSDQKHVSSIDRWIKDLLSRIVKTFSIHADQNCLPRGEKGTRNVGRGLSCPFNGRYD